MEGLNFDNILDESQMQDLFNDDNDTADTVDVDAEENDNKETTEVINTEELFDAPESVGSDANSEEELEKAPESNDKGSSQTKKPNVYSSITTFLQEEGALSKLENPVETPEDFVKAIEQEIQSKLDDKLKRIDAALNAGVDTSDIRKYENTLQYLNNILDNVISNESTEGENLRKQLIYQDFINRGYSLVRAEREVKKSFDSGSDIEDAKEALKSNIEFFDNSYQSLIKENELILINLREAEKQLAENLKKSILEDTKVYGDLKIDKSIRQKAFDSISKPVYKDPETGELFTAVQQYEKDNKTDFLKNVGLLFTLTDGFKNLDKLVKGKVQKEVSASLKELEHLVNNTSKNSDGSLNLASGVGNDEDSFIGKGYKLDI